MKRNRTLQTKCMSMFMSMLMVISIFIPAFASAENDLSRNGAEHINVSEEKLPNQLLQEFDDNEMVTFLVKMKKKADTEEAARQATLDVNESQLSSAELKNTQRSAVVTELKEAYQADQVDVLAYLEEEKDKQRVEFIQPYFVVNGIAVTATKEVAEELNDFPEVAKVLPNEVRQIDHSKSGDEKKSMADNGVEWNVEQIGAPEVWEEGIDGSGIVVASIDTGAEWDHPALKEKYRGYDQETGTVNHEFSWFDATGDVDEPYDDMGHGTHVTGTMVGSEPDRSNQIGVAPGAEWISVKGFTEDGGTDADLLKAAEWILAPTDSDGNEDVTKAPDVVNNSWSGGSGLDEWYRDVVIAWESANIFPEFSAGNTSSGNPGGAESIAAPANYPESFATGATDKDNNLAAFSLLGPSPYDEIKPDISAPGVNIRSAVPGSGYEDGWNGTSMAGPAVAATVALMLQAEPDLGVGDVKELLKLSADPLTDEQYPESPNNGYGYGLVNAYDAVSTITDGIGTLEGTIELENDDNPNTDGKVTVLETGLSVEVDPEDGSFTMVHPAGDVTVQAEAYGHKVNEQKVSIQTDSTTELTFNMEAIPQGTIKGTVFSESTEQAVKDAKVSLQEDSAITPVKTNENGEFDLTGFEGEYTLQVNGWNYHNKDIPITIEPGTMEMEIQLDPNYKYSGEEMIYDDGTHEASVYSGIADSGWGVRISLDENQDTGYVTTGIFYLDDLRVRPEPKEFKVEVWDSSGEDKTPGKKIAGPFTVGEVLERGLNRVEIDLREHKIEVDDDFYMVYIQKGNSFDVPAIGIDMDGKGHGRSIDYKPGAGWLDSPPLGNFMIRANVSYELDEPVIHSPEEDVVTNEKTLAVEGTSSPTTTIHLMNNDEEIDSLTVKEDGEFSFTTDLDEGENDLKVISKFDDDPTATSNAIHAVRDTIKPELNIESPKNNKKTNKEAITVTGKATDDYELDSVQVNGDEAIIDHDSFSKRLILDEGENDIVVTAVDMAGNTTEKTIMVERKSDLPKINNVKPASDQYLVPGDRVTISFKSNVDGGEAHFDVKLPSGKNLQSNSKGNMEEVEPGLYKAEWTVPVGARFNGNAIEVEITDEAGNQATETADGKLFVSKEKVERIAGEIRYDTAVEISQSGWGESDTVILARGDNYADALAGVPLAHEWDVPILLTPNDDLWDNTLAEIKRLGAKQTIVLGGKKAISKSVIDQLKEEGLDTRRIEGDTRFETAAHIAEELSPEGTDKAVVVNGLDFPDAMTVASYAATDAQPILLTMSDRLPDATKQSLKDLNVTETIVAGGAEVVDKTVEKQLPSPIRLGGSDRYETNVKVAQHYGMNSKHLYVATGKEYADALTGAVLSAKHDSGMVLVHDRVPQSVNDFLKATDVKKLTLFGGKQAISPKVKDTLEKLVE